MKATEFPSTLCIAENYYFYRCIVELKNGDRFTALFNDALTKDNSGFIHAITGWEMQDDDHTEPFVIPHSKIRLIARA